ncbi:MAG: DUF4907 domain-containing protein [Prevotellaceae bacterium]|nr:DUF4907 domain-containing protein [Prevotellaceae bacterium]
MITIMGTFINSRISFLIVFCAGLLFYSCGHNSSKDTQKDRDINLKVFELENGKWAYQIDVNGKTFIYQNTIPAVEGIYPFETEEDAFKTANLMVQKMQSDEGGFPSLSVDEVKALKLKGL